MKVKISATSGSGWVKVFIDDKEVLSGPGQTTLTLDENESHTLTWFAQGLPGQAYMVKITEPANEIWQVSGTLKITGKSTGQHII